ncbi:alpha-farnesene synthase-like isoform X2 [Solanum tuberosum]|uniref:alpha-farnesene synthase-like isoform X2 n=1 Tax=Solanum tuberosum TaxID=4113 RepID=UPI00073A0C6F|nr:PREDICTED: alpha-farnesene synthase-like isoform X2 [Solanum tuberosum]
MACRNIVSIVSTMQTQKLYHTKEKKSHPEKISTYKPNNWKYDHLLSLTSQYSEEKYKVKAEKLKEEVCCTFSDTHASPVVQLELIDTIDKLGLTSYFEVEIQKALENTIIYSMKSSSNHYATTALCFRQLLTEHGYNASQDIVDRFTSNPLAWRVRWYDVRTHIINTTQNSNNTNIPMLLKLAKLNFNIIQATHQNDLKDVIRWWRNLCIVEDLEFTRDRIVESFFYAVGIASEAQHGSIRKWITKVIQLVLIIDDVYDIYASLADVQQFTRAIEKWDPNEVEQLPECMQICFRALHATMEEICVEIQEQKGGPSTLPYLKQGWVNFCKALLVEATWHYEGHIPTLEDYLDNGWISSSGSLFSFHVIYCMTNKITNENLDLCKNCQEIIYHVSIIIRLCNDQGTSTAELERGDVASSIICYMQQENVSEDVAREYIKSIILDSWKKINYHFNKLSTSHRKIVNHVINGARMAHLMYHSGDGFGVQDGETRHQILLNLVQPIT